MKRIITASVALLLGIVLLAQTPTGGVKGKVVTRGDRQPIASAELKLSQGDRLLSTVSSDETGAFLIDGLADGMYDMTVSADGFTTIAVNITVDNGFIKDLIFVSMSPAIPEQDVDDSNFTEFDMQDTGYSDSPTILFGENDVYTNIASFGFSSVRFKNRGYNSDTQDVLLGGVQLNDAITGYSPYSLWSGLNEVMRSKESTIGLESSDYAIGRYNGVTNVFANPSNVRKGLRASVLTNSAMYRLRLMLTYSSGRLDNGWSYAFSASARLGGNDWIKGVFYRSFAYYAGAEKEFNEHHTLSFFTFATPGERGTQNASTQEVYNLMGDNMYNSNWGYQGGKVRNSRIRKTFEPVTVVKYQWTPSTRFQSTTTFLWRTGLNGYTALDWYDAADPRPDYYKNLPSYADMADEDFNRSNADKAEWLTYSWTQKGAEYSRYQHVDWDALYNVNYHSVDGRSKYAQEQRHVNQNDFNLAETVKWNISDSFVLDGGINLKLNRTENYKKVADLLGGQYFLNVDNFAEREFGTSEARLQNDLDYWMANGCSEKVVKGGKYGYDYLAQVRKGRAWASGSFTSGGLMLNAAVSGGYECFWREGLVRKGLFAGCDEHGNLYYTRPDGTVYATATPSSGDKLLSTYDSKGRLVTSKGKSDVCGFAVWSAKLGAQYVLNGGHRFYANAGYFNDAPTFAEAFVSPRTRNTILSGLTTRKTFSADANYQYCNHGWNLRITGFYTTIKDQSDVMSYYDDMQHSFVNFAMTGIDQRHIGLELGVKAPLPVNGLSISAALSLGEYIYTSTPRMSQTVDNSAETIKEATVPFWSHSPMYKKHVAYYQYGVPHYEYDKDADGNYIYLGEQKHYVPGTPQLAAELALNYNINYWFLELNGQYFARSFLDMNPLCRTDDACKGGDKNPTIVDYMAGQEEFDPAFLLNASVGKSWFKRGHQIGFSLNVSNILNNKNVRTGGYEATRLINSASSERYYRFDSKYFYMSGINYMLNVYFRF